MSTQQAFRACVTDFCLLWKWGEPESLIVATGFTHTAASSHALSCDWGEWCSHHALSCDEGVGGWGEREELGANCSFSGQKITILSEAVEIVRLTFQKKCMCLDDHKRGCCYDVITRRPCWLGLLTVCVCVMGTCHFL